MVTPAKKTNFEVGHLVLFNASNIDSTIGPVDSLYIIPSNSTIATMINK